MTRILTVRRILKALIFVILLPVLGFMGWTAKDALMSSPSSIVTKNNWDVCSTTSECDTVIKQNYGNIAINRNFIDPFFKEDTSTGISSINIAEHNVSAIKGKSYCGVNSTARCVLGRCRILSSIDTVSYLFNEMCH